MGSSLGKISNSIPRYQSSPLFDAAADTLCMVDLSGSIFTTAIDQYEKTTTHCRSLDCLHLAAMAEIGATHLVPHDIRQAEVALAFGYKVVSPGSAGG